MTAVVFTPFICLALPNAGLIANAFEFINPYWSITATKLRPMRKSQDIHKAEQTADDKAICQIKIIIADGAPFVVVEHFHTT